VTALVVARTSSVFGLKRILWEYLTLILNSGKQKTVHVILALQTPGDNQQVSLRHTWQMAGTRQTRFQAEAIVFTKKPRGDTCTGATCLYA